MSREKVSKNFQDMKLGQQTRCMKAHRYAEDQKRNRTTQKRTRNSSGCSPFADQESVERWRVGPLADQVSVDRGQPGPLADQESVDR